MNALVIAVAVARLVIGSGPGDLDAVRWLSGCWESRQESRLVMEVWSPPVDGVMVGVGLTSSNGGDPAFEHLRIVSAPDNGILYIASPSDQSETSFASTQVTENGFVVENPEHDFPTRIEYVRRDADRFVARVQGPDGDGSLNGFELEFARTRCQASG